MLQKSRRPDKTVLYEVTKRHYATWHKQQEQVPYYVANAFQKYFGCGILAKGFACAHCEGCNKDLIIPFSCKRRGLCPSCNQRAMVETAAHLVDNLLPRIQYRQWVMSFPRRIRHYLETHEILQAVLRMVVDEIRKRLIACSPTAPNPQIAATSFIQHFGNTLNYHPHFHMVVADGIFSQGSEGELQFHEAVLAQDDITGTQECIQRRVLRYFCRRGFFTKDDIATMLGYETTGFSLDASVTVHSFDKDALERLIRYCARPPFASENLRWSGKLLIYRYPKPTHTGKTYIQLDPMDFLDRISKFIPYPRRHRHHFHGAFAPNSPMRAQVASNAQKKLENRPEAMQETAEKIKKAANSSWAQLITRIYEVDPLTCGCGKKIKITAFVTHPEEIRRILRGIGWPVEIPKFDPPYDLDTYDICQLTDSPDGFQEPEIQFHYDAGPDPPCVEDIDPPHCNTTFDSPHWSD